MYKDESDTSLFQSALFKNMDTRESKIIKNVGSSGYSFNFNKCGS